MRRGILIITSAVSLIAALPIFFQPIRGDAAVFSYIADRMLSGGTPYVDAWDLKSPGIFFQYAAELFASHSYSAIYLFDLLWAIAAAWMLRRAVTRFAGDLAGNCAAICMMLGHVGLMYSGYSLQPETPALFFAAWLLDIAARDQSSTARDAIAAGIALAALFWLKLPFVVLGICLLPRLFQSKKAAISTTAIAIASFAFVGVLVFGCFAMKHAVPALIENAFEIPARTTQLYALPWPARFPKLGSEFITYLKPIWSIGILAAVGAGAMLSKWKREHVPTLILLVAGLAVVLIQGRLLYYHPQITFAPLAAMAGIGLASALTMLTPAVPQLAARVAAAIVVLLLPAYSNIALHWQHFAAAKGNIQAYWDKEDSYYYTQDEIVSLGRVNKLVEKLKAETGEADTILAFNLDQSFNLYAKRLSPTRFSYAWPLQIEALGKPEWRAEFVNDLMAKKPKFIIVSRISPRSGADDMKIIAEWPTLNEWFSDNYEFVEALGPLETYRWKTR